MQKTAAVECVKVLQEQIPDWSNALYNDIRHYAIAQGLPENDVNQYVDPAVITLINKARLYDEAKKVSTVKKRNQQPARRSFDLRRHRQTRQIRSDLQWISSWRNFAPMVGMTWMILLTSS